MKNYIEIIYVDDNGIDHHVRKEKLTPYKGSSASKYEMLYTCIDELAVKLRNSLVSKDVY